MKFLSFLLLAIIASSEAVSSVVEQIAKETRSRVIYSPSSRGTVVSRPFVVRAGGTGETGETGETGGTGGTGETDQGNNGGGAAEPSTPKCDPQKQICQDGKLISCNPFPKDPNVPEPIIIECSKKLKTPKGYCNCAGNDCQPTMPTGCPVTSAQKCTKPYQQLPAPDKCDEWTLCVDGFVTRMKCNTPGERYDPTTGRCSSKAPCVIVRCPQNDFPNWCPFSNNRTFYVVTYLDQLRVDQCVYGYEADKTGCNFACPGSGNWADTIKENNDKGVYYTCINSRAPYKMQQNTCPIKDGVQLTMNNKYQICTKPESTGGT